MCIVAIAWQLFDDLPLVLLSNRDEFLERPTTPVHQWDDAPIYAGRDNRSGGTWLGIHQNKDANGIQQNGRWAAVLNFRDGVQAREDERSRGELVTEFLRGTQSPMEFARQIKLQEYAGFNLIVGDAQQAVAVNNRGHAPTPLYAGLHVLSNGQFEDNWFKTQRLRGRLRQEVLPLIAEDSHPDYWQAAAFNVMSDVTPAPVGQLPETGVATDIEQALSSIYIEPANILALTNGLMPSYGTRTQSILTLHNKQDESKIKAQLISLETDTITSRV
nr:NRDE family protein [uncultured Psychrobacter sp.]